jgi:hypothetical protein
LSLVNGLLLTLASATICISLPRLLSVLLAERNKQVKPASQATLPEKVKSEVPTFVTES